MGEGQGAENKGSVIDQKAVSTAELPRLGQVWPCDLQGPIPVLQPGSSTQGREPWSQRDMPTWTPTSAFLGHVLGVRDYQTPCPSSTEPFAKPAQVSPRGLPRWLPVCARLNPRGAWGKPWTFNLRCDHRSLKAEWRVGREGGGLWNSQGVWERSEFSLGLLGCRL